MNKIIVIAWCLLLSTGCVELRNLHQEPEPLPEPETSAPSVKSTALLQCIAEMETIDRKKFNRKYELAEANLLNGTDEDIQFFICLSLNDKADYEQFKHGIMILEQYLEEHPHAEKDLYGFRILMNKLDHAIENKWNSWKTLLNDKKTLKAEVKSLQARINELQQQIEQLKKIEDIIESREMGQP